MKIVVITGQTATGKTKLALEYAKKYNGELINSDSRQIYKHLDIITGKDVSNNSFHLEKKINSFSVGFYSLNPKIWLYDVVSPSEYFSSFDFVKLAISIIKKILSEGKTPILVGGTYLYLKHLLYGIATENIPPNWKLRKELNKKSVKELQKKLQAISPQLFSRLNPSDINNPQRLIRKIEIAEYLKKQNVIEPARLKKKFILSKVEGGKPRRLNEIAIGNKIGIEDLEFEFIGLKFKEKNMLRSAIELRVEKRLKQGAIDEVKKIIKMGFKETDPGLRTIGYQQLLLHLKGGIDIETAIQQWIFKETQYAKRQYTFMKKDKNIKWRDV